jgi:hypothetical protein
MHDQSETEIAPRRCPLCGGAVADRIVWYRAQSMVVGPKGASMALGPMQARVFEVLWRARPGRMDRGEVARRMTDPPAPDTLRQTLHRLAKNCAIIGVNIAPQQNRHGYGIRSRV